MKITIVSSSTRNGRISHRIALALQNSIQSSEINCTVIDICDLNLPAFEERLSYLENPKPQLTSANEILKDSDGLIFLTPEYNGAISSGLKNFIDVFAKDAFEGKPIGVATGSVGAMGGIRAAYQLQQTILSISAYPIPQMLTVGKMDKVLDEQGNIIDEKFSISIKRFLEAYLGFVKKFV